RRNGSGAAEQGDDYLSRTRTSADVVDAQEQNSRAAAANLTRLRNGRLERAHAPGRAARVHARHHVQHRRTRLDAERLHADGAIELEQRSVVSVPVPVGEYRPR